MSKRPSGSSAKRPPRSGSSSAANVVGACSAGSERESTEASAATSAAVRPSPIAAYAPMGAKPSSRFTAGVMPDTATGEPEIACIDARRPRFGGGFSFVVRRRTLRVLSRPEWLGASELRVGLGCMRMSTGDSRDEELAFATIAAAAEAGMTVFDTARAYGRGQAELGHNERLLARALRACGSHATALIGTKVG